MLLSAATVAPYVVSIDRTTPAGPITNASSVSFTATFSEPVSGVDLADFSRVPTGTVATTGISVTSVNPSVYTVTVTGITGHGTLGLNLLDNGSIRDADNNPLTKPNAPASFAVQVPYSTGNSPVSEVFGDVNGDYIPDMIVTNFGDNTVSVLLGNGNGTFAAQQAFATGPSPHSVALGDVNGDLIPDLVVANFGAASVSVLLGNGNGTFAPQQQFAVGAEPTSVALVNVNGGSALDIVTSNGIDNTVSVLLGNGIGGFAPQQTFPTGAQPWTIAVGNLNGDAFPDIVVSNFGGSTVSVLLGDGTGNFSAQQTFATGSKAESVAIGDVNGDGKSDLVVSNWNDATISVLLGNGNGTFQAQQTFATGVNPASVMLADVNGDGNVDAVVGNYGSNTVSVLLGIGNGTFAPQQTFAAGTHAFGVAIGDVNGDGRPDLAIANLGAGNVSVLLGNANGNFTGQAYTIDTAPVISSVTIAPAFPKPGQTLTATVVSNDVDGDPVTYTYQWQKNGVNIPGATGSTLNLTVPANGANGDSIRVIVTPNDGIQNGTAFTSAAVIVDGVDPYVISINRGTPSGAVTSASSVSFTATFSEPVTGVDPADFVLVATGTVATGVVTVTPVTTSVYSVTVSGITGIGTLGLNLVDNGSIHDLAGNPLNTPNAMATFANQTTISTGAGPFSMTVGDVNGDGKADLIVANKTSNTMSVFLGNGNGTFAAPLTFATGTSPDSVTLGDVNGDGKPDVIVGNYGSNNVSVLLGNGNGTFAAQQTFAAGTMIESVAVADFNGDGKADIVVANYNTQSVNVLLGNGNGTFGAATSFNAGTGPYSVKACDLNGDGKVDLVVANRGSSSVSVLLGNGNGTFGTQQTFATGTNPVSLSLGDVNGDGKADIVVVNRGSNSVSVLLGNGNGTFAAQQTFATGATPISVALGDVNGDGKVDIVVSNYGSNSVNVLLGNGNGTFQPQSAFATSTHPRPLALGDLNGDGKLDILVGNVANNTVSVLLGNYNGNFTGQTYTFVAGPVITSVTITPSSPTTNQTLTTTVASTDPLGNPVTYTYQWQKNGVNIPGATSPTLNLSVLGNGDKGDVITVIVTPNDGVVTGNPFISPSVTVVDSAPVISSVTISPSSPGTNQTLTTTVVSTDADGDAVTYTYQWTKNGVNIPAATSSTLDLSLAGNGDNGDVIAVKVTPNDGTLSGTVFTSPSVTVGNAAPVISSVTINPSSPTTNQTLTTIVVSSDADGNPVTYTYQWTKNGVNIPGATGATLDLSVPGNGDKGDSIAVKVTPNDGMVNGTTFTSPPVTVGDTAPVITSVTISPAFPKPNQNQTFTATVVSSDADGDPVTYTYQWTKNGVPIPAATGPSLNLPSTMNGDVIMVSVTPNDGTLNGVPFVSTVVVDGIDPYVVSINRGTPPGAATNASSVSFTVTFSEPVTGVDPADFFRVPTGTVATTGIAVTPVTTSVYTVTVSGITGAGTLGLNLVDNGTIQDLAGNPLDNPSSPATFAPQTTIATGANPIAVTSGDVNSDGIADLIVANFGSDTVGVLIGTGGGNFAAPAIYPTGLGSKPHSVTLGDVNGDHIADLIVSNFGGTTVSVLLGNANGTFQTPLPVTVGTLPTSVAVVDTNGDGKADLVVSNGVDNTVSVLLGNGNGTFAPQQTFGTGPSPWSVAAADLNHDGKVDLVTSNFGGSTISVLLGNGDGTFAPQVTYNTGSQAESIVLGDVNGDHILDAVVSNWGDATVSVLLGTGTGTFQPQTVFATGAAPASATLADVNGDGKADIVVASYGNNTVSVLLGNGNGTFAPQQSFSTGSQSIGLAVQDLNGDGKPDLVVTNFNGSNLSVLLGNYNGNFTGQLYTITPGPVITSVTIAPSSPTTNQTLTTTVVSTDALNNPVTYTYQWQKNGVNIPGATGSTLDLSIAGNGDRGDLITVIVTPDDGVVTGAPFTATAVTVVDTAPVISSVTIAPSSPTTNQTLTATVVSSDADGDSVTYSYQWTKNGVNIPGATGSTLNLSVAGNGDKGDLIAVKVTPNDGTLSGTVFTATSVTVVNTAPVISSVTITPSSPTTNQTLTTTVVSSDADGDPVTYTYQWTKNGVNIPGATGSTLNLGVAGNGDKGDLIGVKVTPNDGTLSGTTVTSLSVTVVNSAPVISSVTITPPNPGLNQTLTATVVSSDADGDPVTYSYQWQKNGVNIPGATGSTLNLTSLMNGASIRVIVTPNDGTVSGAPFTSAPVTIDGIHPYVVTINRGTPPGPTTNASSVCFVVTFSEAVTGVDPTDFVLAKTGTVAASGITVTPVSTSVYQVMVNGITGNGTLGLNLVDNGSIHDLAGNPLDNPATTASFANQTTFATGAGPFSMILGDVNGDGNADLIVANKTSNSISVFLGNGNGTFAAPQTFATGLMPISVALGDVNGDGKQDVVVGNYGSNTVSVLLGNGNGTFAAQQTFAAGTTIESVAVADVNGDGKADIVVANYNSNKVNVLLNNGSGTFAAPTSFAAGTGPYSVKACDVNGDGKVDLVVANRGSSSVSVLLGNGNGTFAAQQTFPTGTNPVSLTLGDVNGDGKKDIVVANRGSNSVSVLLGNGNGTFAAQQTFATGALPISVALGDMNGDGKADIVVTNYGSNTVNVLLGNGNGTFQPQQSFSTSTHPRAVALGDLNGDGKLDILVGNVGNNTVSVLLGNNNGNFTGQLYTIDQGPVIQSVTISPSNPTTNQTLTATVVSTHPLGFAVTYTYQWKKNNVNIPGATGSTLNLSVAGNGDKGDVITVIVTPNDGTVTGAAFTSASVTVIDTAPVIAPQSFSVPEGSPNTTFVGNVFATDVDPTDTKTFSITAGNSLGAFTISASGVITVANSTKLVKATNPTFSLTVKVLDSSGLFSTAVISIILT